MNEIISAAVLLILIMDPLGNLPIFMSVLKHTEPKRRRAIMVRELLIALLVMLVFLFAGEKIAAGFRQVKSHLSCRWQFRWSPGQLFSPR